jgi:hypothetical protein
VAAEQREKGGAPARSGTATLTHGLAVIRSRPVGFVRGRGGAVTMGVFVLALAAVGLLALVAVVAEVVML